MFFAVVTILVLLCHLYLWKRLVADTTSPRTPARRISTAVLVVLVLLMVAALGLGTSIAPEIAQWFAWPGYLWLAMFFYLLLGLLLLEIPRLALRPWVRRGDTATGDVTTGKTSRVGVATGAVRTEGISARGTVADEAPARGSTTAGSTGERGAAGSGGEPEAPAGESGIDRARPGMSRRVLLARGSAAVAGTVATGLVSYGVPMAMGPPSITHMPITVPKLDPRVAGFRIALISDVHLGPLLGRAFTQRIVDLTNAEQVDAVALAGDLVDGDVAHLADAAAPLARLRSTYGTYYVTGNHEYYVGYRQWVEFLPTLGIRTLRNQRVEIEHNGGVFDLAGINDATGYQWQDAGDVGAALAGRDPGRAVVLVAHQPVDVTDAVEHDVDLMLAGHTHGGQLTPFNLMVSLQQGAVAGLYRYGSTQMYVTRGAGFWGPPVRVGAPPDITIVELRPGDTPVRG